MIFDHQIRFIFNKVMLLNESSIIKLKMHQGKSFQITLLGISFEALIDVDGSLIKPSSPNHTVKILAPLSLATYLINQDQLNAFSQIKFIGDNSFGRELLEILSNLQLSAIYKENSLERSLILNKINQIIQFSKNNLHLLHCNISKSISEYLLYETEDLVTHYEIDEFCDEVDHLGNRVDILKARINLLLKPKI